MWLHYVRRLILTRPRVEGICDSSEQRPLALVSQLTSQDASEVCSPVVASSHRSASGTALTEFTATSDIIRSEKDALDSTDVEMEGQSGRWFI